MYLVDTNVISEARKHAKADGGVRAFFEEAAESRTLLFISVVTVGELRRGVELIRRRGDARQADQLERWLEAMLATYQDFILDIDRDTAQVWGRLMAPHPGHALDKLIAATALIHDLTVVTRNSRDFSCTGVKLLNPFKA